MSSSVGYGYSYVDVEAQRQRALRAEIAQLRQRLAMLREQSAAVAAKGGRRRTMFRRATAAGTVAERASSTELQGIVTKLAAEVQRQRAQLDTALNGMWAARLSAPVQASAGAAVAERAASVVIDKAAGLDTVRADALAEAGTLMRDNASRCDTADLTRLEDLLGELASAPARSACHDLLFEIKSVVKDSIDRRRRAEETELVRTRLLALAEDAAEDERDDLRAAVEVAHEPAALRERVMLAVGRADRARARAVVAEATADALREIGCDLGADFTTRLTDGEHGVAAFTHPDGSGYGLVVRLPDDQAQLRAAIVRRADVDADEKRDLAVQQDFCRTRLPQAVRRLGDSGIELHQTLRLEPGQLAPRPVDPDGWPPRTVAPAAATVPTATTTTKRTSKKKPNTRTTPELAKELRRAHD